MHAELEQNTAERQTAVRSSPEIGTTKAKHKQVCRQVVDALPHLTVAYAELVCSVANI